MSLSNNELVFDFARALKKWLLILLVFFCFNTIGAQQSMQELRAAIELKEQHENRTSRDTVYITNLIDLANSLRFHNLDSVLLLSNKALKLSKDANFISGKALSHELLGNYYSDKGNSEKALENYNKALEIIKYNNYYTMKVNIYNSMGIEYLYNHKLSEALGCFMNSLEISKENESPHTLSDTFSYIGGMYNFYLNDYDQALYFFNEAKKIEEKEKGFIYYAALCNLADTYFKKGELDSALVHLTTSTKYFEKEGRYDWLLTNYATETGVFIKQKKIEEAIISLKKLENLHQDMQDSKSLTTMYKYKFDINLHLKNLVVAEEYAHKEYHLSKEIHLIDGVHSGLKNLYLVNREKGDFDTALKYHEMYQSLSDSLLKEDNRKNLDVLLAKVEYDEQKRKIIQENEIARAKQNRYIIIAVMVLCIIFCIVFLIWKNTKTQEKFNTQLRQEKEKLEKNELFLKEANRTKDKLFSIIGHDLRSPIGAFKGLLTLFKDKEIDEDEFISFIPKLEADLGGISFMLNNLLSWGRSQMNGDTTTPEVVEAKNLVTENINLLSEVARNKAIAMVNEVPSDACIWADGNQIDIVFRNLMSNALKFTDDHGVITIGGEEMEAAWRFYVKDTGIGMDTEAQEKIFIKNSTHTTYGTHNEKGTGLGLNLCKEMVQKNKGTIWVESALQKGSCFYFEIPKAKQVFKNVG